MREQKKLDRLKKIEETALFLFDKNGFAAVAMEKIAENAGLGVGTLYNYYSSKADLLIGIVSRRAVTYEQEILEIIKHKSRDVLKTLCRCYSAYINCFSFFSRRIWREFTATILAKGLPLFEMILKIDAVFIKLLAALFLEYQNEGIIRKEVSVQTAAETCYSIFFYQIMNFIASDTLDAETLLKTAEHQSALVITGL